MFRATILSTVCLSLLAAAALAQSQPADAKQRLKTVRELAKTGGSTTIPELRGYLKDPEVKIRVEAVKAIASIGTIHSLDALVEAAGDNDPEVQAWATDGLVNFYYPGYLRTGFTASLKRAGTSIKGKFTDTNDQIIDPYVEVRPDVIEAIGKLARGGATLEVRANAARAVGVLRGRAAIPDLQEALRTKDSQVIYEVLVALRKIGDPEAYPAMRFLVHDLEEKVQLAAIETAGLLGNKAALPDLRGALTRADSDKVRSAALTAIGRLPDASSRNLYEQYLTDKKEDMRAAAAEGFARLHNPADLPELETAFQNEKKMNPRLSMAFALVMLGQHDMGEFGPLRYLVNTLNSGSWRGVAYAFLVEAARDASVRASLYPAMNERTREEKVQLATIFARSGQKDAMPVLEALSRDGDLQVAQEGARALRILQSRLL